MIKTTLIEISKIICISFLIFNYYDFISIFPTAYKIPIERNQIIIEIKETLNKLEAEKEKIDELTQAIFISHLATKLNPKLIIALMYTESSFDQHAVGPPTKSKKTYKGLMQTPIATFEFCDVDTLHGVRILEQKLEITDNNLRKALALYKGGNNKTALKQADEVLKLYKSLQ